MPDTRRKAGAASRRILLRKCYLNPDVYREFRPYLIRNAFEVIDCPPLTSRGKTSTDIHMVMDILDALSHPTWFNEFIILSGDADFTPVLTRLRMHNRYSAVLSVGQASTAYKSACDYFILQDTFVRDALGIETDDEMVPHHSLLEKMAARLYELADTSNGIEARQLPEVYKDFLEFRRSSNWLGFYYLRDLTQALVSKRNDLEIVGDDPWRVMRRRVIPIENGSKITLAEAESSKPDSQKELHKKISLWLQEFVRDSKTPVVMASLAQGIKEKFGDFVLSSDWLGTGSFKNLLSQLDLNGLIVFTEIPGYVYDPLCHQPPVRAQTTAQESATPNMVEDRVDLIAPKYPNLAPLAQKVHRLTETPYLPPEYYATLLQEIANEINEQGYQLTRTSKAVRDRCVEKGAPISRAHVNFILVGIGFTGYRFGENIPETARNLGDVLLQNIFNLCRTAQLNLTEAEMEQMQRWIIGALPTR
jgi:hypothetical protein